MRRASHHALGRRVKLLHFDSVTVVLLRFSQPLLLHFMTAAIRHDHVEVIQPLNVVWLSSRSISQGW